MNQVQRWVVIIALICAGCGAPKTATVDPAGYIGAGNALLQGIMQGQFQAVYEQWISPGAKFNPKFSLPQFTADWQAIFEKYGPITRAELMAYQPVPGRRVTQLYYQVSHEKAGTMEYHLVAESDKAGHATVFLLDIGNAQVYPPVGEPGEKKAPGQKIEVLP